MLQINCESNERRIKALAGVLANDLLLFSQYFFELLEGEHFISCRHHARVVNVLERVYAGEITRLIINIPPGFTKTQLAVISFISWALAKTPESRFFQISYSDRLANENSRKIRDIVTNPEYQGMYGLQLRRDSTAKSLWRTEPHDGGLVCAPFGGQIAGFRAGRMSSDFSGALIIDDPLKPADAWSKTKRDTANQTLQNTIKSRLALNSTPIILIMQRLHYNDPCGFLLRGGTGEHWHHLNIPAVITDELDDYPAEYTHGIPIDHRLPPGAVWPEKIPSAAMAKMKVSDPYTYQSQYMGQPIIEGDGLIKTRWFREYQPTDLPRLSRLVIYADTALETGESNDWSVFLVAALGIDGNLYILDVIRVKVEAPQLLELAKSLWQKWRAYTRPVSAIKVERKASGYGLLQQLKQSGIIAQGIDRTKDKVVRVMECVPALASGRVYLPIDAAWRTDYDIEVANFSEKLSGHDDQVDATMDAISDLVTGSASVDYGNA